MNFELTLPSSGGLSETQLKSEILSTNEKSYEYGLVLSEKDALMLVQAGKDAIALQERIEFGKSATVRLIEKFMHSTYLSQSDYASTLAALIEVFYEVKEESLDILTDGEVIDIMFDFFERESGGDIDALQTRDLEYLCRNVRDASLGLLADSEPGEEEEEETDE